MKQQDDKLILMIENIVSNFSAYPQNQQITSVKNHVLAFWSRDMIDQILSDFSNHPQSFSTPLQEILESLKP